MPVLCFECIVSKSLLLWSLLISIFKQSFGHNHQRHLQSNFQSAEKTALQPIDTSILYDTINAWLANIFKSNDILPLQHFSAVWRVIDSVSKQSESDCSEQYNIGSNRNDTCQLAWRIAKNLEATFSVTHIWYKFCSPSFHSIGCVHCDIWEPERLFCGVITVEKCGVLQHAPTPLPSFHPSPPPNSAPGSCISISPSCIAQCVVCLMPLYPKCLWILHVIYVYDTGAY